MTIKKNTRSDSAAGIVAAFAGAQERINPPENTPLREQDLPFWENVTRARAANTWSELDLVIAVNLSRTLADIEAAQRELDQTGFVVENARGNPVQNPLFNILETLKRSATSLSKHLQVHSHATNGPTRETKQRNVAQRSAASALSALEDDGLIPMSNSSH